MTASDTERLVEDFYTVETESEARAILARIEPQKCIELIDITKMPAFLTKGIIYFPVDDMEETAGESLRVLYRNAFHIMTDAMLTAEKAGKPLRILMGETHGDRTGLAIELMLYAIAARLGFQDFALERAKEDFKVSINGKEVTIHGLEGMRKEIATLKDGEVLSEQNKPENAQMMATVKVETDARKNDYWLAEWVIKNRPDANLIASDPRISLFFSGKPILDNMLSTREEATHAILEKVAQENKNIISQHGIYHLPNLQTSTENAHILSFNTQQVLVFDSYEINFFNPDDKNDFFGTSIRNPRFITKATTEDAARAIGRECTGKAGQQARIIHLLSSGRGIDNGKDAAEMAKAVDAELGDDMMALYALRRQKLASQGTSRGSWAERTTRDATSPHLGA